MTSCHVDFDHLANGTGGRILTQREVPNHLRMVGRGKAKDVAGVAPEHLCVALGHRDLGSDLTISESTRATDGNAPEQGNQGQATTNHWDVRRRVAELPTEPSSVLKPQTSPRYLDRHSALWDGMQHWNQCGEKFRRRTRQKATRQCLNSIVGRHSITRTVR